MNTELIDKSEKSGAGKAFDRLDLDPGFIDFSCIDVVMRVVVINSMVVDLVIVPGWA